MTASTRVIPVCTVTSRRVAEAKLINANDTSYLPGVR